VAEPYFQFKKFRVYHATCGFKVGTDGVLLGAWTPIKNGDSVLDIGTGSGLISLMLAQRAEVDIDAIEINECAAKQASRNFERSAFSNIRGHHSSVADWANSDRKYDLIVCNPPFYSHAQPSKDPSIAMAKHTVSLTPVDLFACAKKLLKDNGRFCIIFPKTEYDVFWKAAKKHYFFANDILNVFPLPDYPEIRLLVNFVTTDVGKTEPSNLFIEKSKKRHDYSEEYKALTKDFFLRF